MDLYGKWDIQYCKLVYIFLEVFGHEIFEDH